jgi:hypothetical protein
MEDLEDLPYRPPDPAAAKKGTEIRSALLRE